MNVTFGELVGAILAGVAILVVGYSSIVQSNEGAMTAMVGVVGTAGGYFLRAKLQSPQ